MDFSQLVRRHPKQIMSPDELVLGGKYAFVHACSSRGIMVIERTFFGWWSSCTEEEVTDSIRVIGKNTLGFTLHGDGWLGVVPLCQCTDPECSNCAEDRDRPSMVYWQGTLQGSYSGAGYPFGLDDTLPDHDDPGDPDYNAQHHLLVPMSDWDQDRSVSCVWSDAPVVAAPEAVEYKLFVCCSRGGMVRDSGEHDRCEATTDAEACAELKREALQLAVQYDRVSCTVTQGDRVVKKWTL